jgi:hypothetical protein
MEHIHNISMVLCTQFNLNLPRLHVAYSGPDIAGLPSRRKGMAWQCFKLEPPPLLIRLRGSS